MNAGMTAVSRASASVAPRSMPPLEEQPAVARTMEVHTVVARGESLGLLGRMSVGASLLVELQLGPGVRGQSDRAVTAGRG